MAVHAGREAALAQVASGIRRNDPRSLPDRRLYVRFARIRIGCGLKERNGLTGPALLLTGATGLVGRHLAAALAAARPDRRLVFLVRNRERVPVRWPAGTTILEGDIRRPGLGLAAATLAGLRNSLTEIIHCAADVRFGLPLDEARLANTVGTANVLALAASCARLEKLAHMSTVFVLGRSVGRVPEGPLPVSPCFSNTYQQSKYEAELLVFESMTRVPAAIFRLSSIIGDSRTGRVEQFNYVHQVLRLLPRNVLPCAPVNPAAPIDLIATDWAAAAVAYVFDQRFKPGSVYHFCAGPDGSLSVREMIDLTVEALERHPRARRLLPLRLPEFVSLERYEAWVENARRDGDRLLNDLLRALSYFLPHLALVQAFDNANARAALAGSGVELPQIRSYYGKVIDYCLQSDWQTT